jgi:hypothetical protein
MTKNKTKNKMKEMERGREGKREKEVEKGGGEEGVWDKRARGQAVERNDGRNCWARHDKRWGRGGGGRTGS